MIEHPEEHSITEDGIINEGKIRKFPKHVEQVSFSAAHSQQIGQTVLYVTERAVFRLVAEGLELIEIAPGINLQTQVLDLMDFEPIVGDVRPMPPHVFNQPISSRK